jgi:hypothetical protein
MSSQIPGHVRQFFDLEAVVDDKEYSEDEEELDNGRPIIKMLRS